MPGVATADELVAFEVARHKHTMYALVEADLTVPRRLIREHCERTGEKLSLTAYVTTCVAAAVRQVHDEIRAGQAARHETIAGERWLRLVPAWAARPLMWWMRRSARWALRLGVVGVNT
ncbi:MAG: hypothetical protein WCF12_15600 [Propionicimonas sp.]